MALVVFGCLAATAQLQAKDKPAASHEAYTYDETQQVTVSGKIQEVRDYECPITGTVGAHISVKAETGTIEVHLAPVTFLKDYDITLHAGDDVKVVGAKIVFQGKPALLAKTVAVGPATFTFREPSGKPLW
jgi:DNA/RNA endonuclease YhcR with UshA esterase domain